MTTITKSEAQKLLKAPPKKKPAKSSKTFTFYDDGRSLLKLREAYPEFFYDQSWYGDQDFVKETEKPCMRTIRILHDSNNKTFNEQKALLEKDEEVTKARQLVMLSVLLQLKGEEPIEEMMNGWIRCAEETTLDSRVVLYWREGRLGVDGCWDADRHDRVFLSSTIYSFPSLSL